MSAVHSRDKWGRKRNIRNGKLEKHVVETIETDTAINNARAALSEGGHSDTVGSGYGTWMSSVPLKNIKAVYAYIQQDGDRLECGYFSLLCSKRCTPLGISNYFHNDYLWT